MTSVHGELHKADGPAVVCDRGAQIWFSNGMKHRGCDLPAFVDGDVRSEWWMYDRLHRLDDKPAVVVNDVLKKWCRDGRLGRTDGLPDTIFDDGTWQWHTYDSDGDEKLRCQQTHDGEEMHFADDTRGRRTIRIEKKDGAVFLFGHRTKRRRES